MSGDDGRAARHGARGRTPPRAEGGRPDRGRVPSGSAGDIAPAKLEARLKSLPFVQEAVVIGDRRNFVVALFTLDPEGLGTWAQQQGVPADPRHEAVTKAIQAHVHEVNKSLASFESVKYFRTLPEPFSVENGVLTASLKVKRRVVEERFSDVIEGMYKGSAAA